MRFTFWNYVYTILHIFYINGVKIRPLQLVLYLYFYISGADYSQDPPKELDYWIHFETGI
jgi:hypothetical protein